MAKVWSTSPAGLKLIQTFEGCEKRRPDGTLEVYQVGADLPTVGWGQTGQMPDGRPVVEGLTITQQEADDALMYFVRNVVDPLVRKHFVCQTQAEHDACASWVYNVNHGKLERGEYSLPRLVNAKHRDTDALVTLWMRYIHTKGFENGLYRRRLAEVLMFMGLPWHKPAVWGYVSSAVYQRGGVVQPTDPMFILDVAEQAAMTEDEITADLNNQQLIKLQGKPAKPQKAAEPAKAVEPEPEPKPAEKPPEPAPAPPAPKVDPALPPKPMEQSQTHRGLSKAESGRETVVVGGTLTGIGALLPQLQAVTAYIEKFPAKSILYTMVIIGIIVAIVGAWRWFAGRMIAWEGRVKAERTKV
jgi:GH24 family phage-related lysozyme (muramidase)